MLAAPGRTRLLEFVSVSAPANVTRKAEPLVAVEPNELTVVVPVIETTFEVCAPRSTVDADATLAIVANPIAPVSLPPLVASLDVSEGCTWSARANVVAEPGAAVELTIGFDELAWARTKAVVASVVEFVLTDCVAPVEAVFNVNVGPPESAFRPV